MKNFVLLLCCTVFLTITSVEAYPQSSYRSSVSGVTMRRKIVMTGKVYYRRTASAKCDHKGTVEPPFVTLGTKVKKGTPLGRIRLSAEQAEKVLQRTLRTDIESQELTIKEIEERINWAEDELDRALPLVNENLVPAESVNEQRRALELLRLRKKNEEQKLHAMETDYRLDMEELAEELGLESIRPQAPPTYAQVLAPIGGTVVQTIFRDTSIDRPVLEHWSCAKVADTSQLYVKVEIYEDELANLKQGDIGLVKLRHDGSKAYKAVLQAKPMVPIKNKSSRTPMYEVQFRIINPDQQLKEGFSATVTVNN